MSEHYRRSYRGPTVGGSPSTAEFASQKKREERERREREREAAKEAERRAAEDALYSEARNDNQSAEDAEVLPAEPTPEELEAQHEALEAELLKRREEYEQALYDDGRAASEEDEL